ncbi:MAG: hypothetical protein WAM82_20715 [Thermoanaerobaculia bacterium]
MPKSRRLLLLSFFCSLFALAGLASLHYIFQLYQLPESWWFHLAVHSLSLIGAAGIVGFSFEFFLRKDLLHEFREQMRDFFEQDAGMAKLLDPEIRRERVKATLKAQIGEDIGGALFDGVVDRYFSRPSLYRRDFVYEATVADLDSDIVIESRHPLTLKKDDYYRLTITQKYERAFPETETISIGCIWSDDFQELNYWFSQPDCIYREQVVLTSADQQAIIGCLQDLGAKHALEGVEKLLHIEYLRIDGVELKRKSTTSRLREKSAGIVFLVPKRTVKSRLAAYEIQMTGLVCKGTRQHPVMFGEPTADPDITFNFPARDIASVLAAPIFSGKSAFEPRIDSNPASRRVHVGFGKRVGNPTWVFPNSGVVFFWDRT